MDANGRRAVMSLSKAVSKKHGVMLLLAIPCLLISGCTSSTPPEQASSPASTPGQTLAPEPGSQPPAPTGSSKPASESGAGETQESGNAQALLARMSLEEKIGQVLMTGFPATGSSAQDRDIIAEHSLGNVFLKGRSTEGLEATKAEVDRVKKTIAKSQDVAVAPYVATDQEGGLVQVLKGSGFDSMPAAKVQGTWAPSELKAKATTWGKELAGAGINVNLAPVADTVPSAAFAPSNGPIGHFGRQFGFTPQAVSASSMAFSEGMLAAGVDPVVKHFPGLGRVTKNTDVASNVTDTKTTRQDDYLQPFRNAIQAGNQWVMVSNAYYSKIDAENIAPFSETIMRDMLRSDLGFEGIVVSDDVCEANQLSPWGLGERALRFFEAGGTMLLCVDSGKTATMADALAKKAMKDPEFAKQIDQAALTVLKTKAAG